MATVNGEAGASSETAWKAVTNVAKNRVGTREWKKYTTVQDVIANTGFDAYPNHPEYKSAMKYLTADKFGTNSRIDNIATTIYGTYKGTDKDITGGAVLYYSPKAQKALSVSQPDKYKATPGWNFDVISEVSISGMKSSDDFKFYKYK